MGTFFIKQLHTLDSFSFSFQELNNEWGCDKRYGMDALQRFLYINKRALDFLNAKAEVEVVGNNPYLRIYTSKFAGCVPMMSPKDGKPCGDLCIGGRFGEDFSELLSIIGNTLLPEYSDVLPQLSSTMLEPPLYFECCNFIDKWFDMEKAHWNKFDVIERIENLPNSGTRWDMYALKSFDPSNNLRFQNRSNKLSPLHKEFRQLISVLYVCFDELHKPQTPMRSRIAYSNKITRLQSRYSDSLTIDPPIEFVTHASDPLAIKEIKNIANIILHNKRTNNRAWRIDYSVFFERYVQYVFGNISKSIAMQIICNPHYQISGKRPSWALHYLEPDLILQNNEIQYVLDAKYKSHMFNINENSDELKEVFRHDLHQILAYCSFNTMSEKKAFLIYPFNDFVYRKLSIKSPLTRSEADIFIVGIPLTKSKLNNVKEQIYEMIRATSF